MHTRREFLATLARSTAGLSLLGCLRPSSLGASGGAPRIPIGLQLYTVRSLMARDFDGTLARVADIGYREVEFAGYFGRTPAQVREALARHGLRAPSTHIALPADDAAWARTLEEAKAIGHDWVTIAWLDAPLRSAPADWARVADRFNHLGRLATEAGLHFAYHNHDFEFAHVAGTTMFDTLLERTDPKLVGIEMDVYWVTKGGSDPSWYLRHYPGRFPMLHLKDATAAPERRMVDVGAGTIDWAALLTLARGQGTSHAFVEHDQPADPLASIRASYSYLSRLTY
ncbi:MAG TPA: sugar phosphate isomerase/epimerase [Gemmatimonadaceae bacterium]|nr:sugar phosphate isomerase/epimerase [Gemmatimonadaceae bacterium]